MKSRNREVNIFNMSLLDILCGALGAFCFMMLALFPYYTRKGGSVSVEQVQDLQRKLAEATQMAAANDRSGLVKSLQEQIAKYQSAWQHEAQMRQNAEKRAEQAVRGGASPEEVADLQRRLTQAMQMAGARDQSGLVQNLQRQIQQYQAAWQKEAQARQKAEQLAKETAYRYPVNVQSWWLDDADVDLFVRRNIGKYQEQPTIAKKQGITFEGDAWWDIRGQPGSESWLMRDIAPGMEAYVYVKLMKPANRPSTVVGLGYYFQERFQRMPVVKLTPQEPIVLVGKFFLMEDGKLRFVPAIRDMV